VIVVTASQRSMRVWDWYRDDYFRFWPALGYGLRRGIGSLIRGHWRWARFELSYPFVIPLAHWLNNRG